MFFLIGHRGVGKTSLGKHFKNFIDLDAEIGEAETIKKIFTEQGETYFRSLEKKTLNNILETHSDKSVIALGAGFELDDFDFPENSRFIWIQRPSDKIGRIFLDRPRLNEKEDPLSEFLERKRVRTKTFEKKAHFKFSLIEGDYEAALSQTTFKRLLNGEESGDKRSFYTLEKEEELEFYKGPVELRTDYFSENQILKLLKSLKTQRPLVALRNSVSKEFLESIKKQGVYIDVPVEEDLHLKIGESIPSDRLIYSCHQNLKLNDLEKLSHKAPHLKWAPLVKDLESLERWDKELERFDNISFLPRSENSSGFMWYRAAKINENRINFFRYSENRYPDQPLYMYLNKNENSDCGAVIGEEVNLSHSPAFHFQFFKENFSSNYYSVPLKRGEFHKQSLEFLQRKKINFLAVTAPFKKDLANIGSKKEPQNTAHLNDEVILTANTDRYAIQELCQNLEKETSVCILGSGAVGAQIFHELVHKNKRLISYQKFQRDKIPEGPYVLVWACGALRSPPQDLLKERLCYKIYDLEYKEHSCARFLAQEIGAEYISGRRFFEKQALEQQKLYKDWTKKDI